MDTKQNYDYITQEESVTFKQLFTKLKNSYKEKDTNVSDREWLIAVFKLEYADSSEKFAEKDAEAIMASVGNFEKNLHDVNDAAKQGVSKEQWLADHVQRNTSGIVVNEFSETMQSWDDILKRANHDLAEAVKRKDGQVNMNPNLNGNLAEHMIAKSLDVNSKLQNKNISVRIPASNTKNSVDIILTHDGGYQRYQCKFYKDAKATIQAIEKGNYNSQRIIVPSEQLDEVKAHFAAKGSQKNITDHIEVDGISGANYTKEDLLSLQEAAQQDGLMPSMDYSNYQPRQLAASIGKNAGIMALLSMAVTTGANLVQKFLKGEKIEADELVKDAITSGTDTSVKVITAGTLQIAVRKGILKILPKNTPAGMLANIACVAIENVKVLWKVAKGELSLTQGIDQMGRTTVAMISGFMGAAVGMGIAATIPVVGVPLAVVTGFIGGMIGYSCGEKIGDMVYTAAKKVASVAKEMVKKFINAAKTVVNKVKAVVKKEIKVTY